MNENNTCFLLSRPEEYNTKQKQNKTCSPGSTPITSRLWRIQGKSKVCVSCAIKGHIIKKPLQAIRLPWV